MNDFHWIDFIVGVCIAVLASVICGALGYLIALVTAQLGFPIDWWIVALALFAAGALLYHGGRVDG